MPLSASLRTVLAALAGLGLAACGGGGEDVPGETLRVDAAIARYVNDTPIYLADVELEAASQGLITPGDDFGPDHADYQTVLDQLIDQRLMAQEAELRGLDEDPAARRRLATARERVLGNILVESLVASAVDETAIRKMYAEQTELQQFDDEVRIRHILVSTREDAERVFQRIMNGEDFTTVAFEESEDTQTRIEGGELGYVQPVLMGEPFTSVIGDTRTGDVAEPFEGEKGWHVIKVEDRRTPPPRTLEEMRPEIVTFLTYTEISKILKALRLNAVIEPGTAAPAPEAGTEPADGDEPATGRDAETDRL